MNERMIRFIELLNQMFELDKSDLDFGIYRILNIRRKEIQKFFTEGLPRQIRETLEPFAGLLAVAVVPALAAAALAAAKLLAD